MALSNLAAALATLGEPHAPGTIFRAVGPSLEGLSVRSKHCLSRHQTAGELNDT
jgi:hypothetical protein